MSRSARVQSIDALGIFAGALRSFGEEASVALADLEAEVSRAIQWVRYELKEYWTRQIRLAQTEVAEARLNLERKQMFQDPDERRSFWEEKKALEAAQRRLRVGQEKLDAVRRWTRLLDREFMDYKGNVAPLAGWLQADWARGLALLKRLSGTLESYVSLESAGEAVGTTEQLRDAPAEPGEPHSAEDGDSSTTAGPTRRKNDESQMSKE
jgi:hypothetical protein